MVDYSLPAISTDPLDPDVWGQDVTDAFSAFDAEVEAPRAVQALRSWRASLAGRWTSPTRIVCIGSSTTFGTGASVIDRRYVNRLGDLLHARFNPPGIAGGAHVAGVDTGWATTGTVGTAVIGLGLQSVTLAIGATMSRTFSSTTGVTILFEQGPGAGQFSASIDGGAATTITPDTTGAANRHDGTWSSSVLTAGSHSLTITAIGACVISGVYGHSGDLAAGVQVYQSGRAGAVTSDFLGVSIPTRIAQLGAGLCPIMLGANEYATGVAPATFSANLTTLIGNIKAVAYPPPAILLPGTYPRLDVGATPAYPWPAYLDVMRELAANDPVNIAYGDVSQHFPASNGADAWNLLDPDLVHPTDRGHAHIAEQVEQSLRSPRLAGMRIHTPAKIDPSGLSGLLARYDASAITGLANNDPVSSWPPVAGTETAALAQTGTNRPTYLTGRINGRPAVSLNAANSQSMDTGAWAASHPVPITIAVVARFDLNGANPMNWWSGRSGVYVYAGSTPTVVQVGAGAAGEINSREPADLAWHVAVIVYNGASSTIHWDSRSFTTRGTTGTGVNAALPGLRLGTNSGASGNFLTGEIADLSVIGRALTQTEISGVVAYLADRYALPVA